MKVSSGLKTTGRFACTAGRHWTDSDGNEEQVISVEGLLKSKASYQKTSSLCLSFVIVIISTIIFIIIYS